MTPQREAVLRMEKLVKALIENGADELVIDQALRDVERAREIADAVDVATIRAGRLERDGEAGSH